MTRDFSLVPILLLSLASGTVFLGLLTLLSRSPSRRSTRPILFVFLLAGLGSLVLAGGFYTLVSLVVRFPQSGSGHHLFIWLVNAPVEELAKFFCFMGVVLALKTVREPQDGSLQGAACGLGFALGENFLYALEGGWELLVLRIVVSLPGHMIYGAVWGGAFSFEVFRGNGRVNGMLPVVLALVPAVFFHALFNTLAALHVPLVVNALGDGLALVLGLVLFWGLRSSSPMNLRLPYSRWKEAVPLLDQGLRLNPQSYELRLRLGAYLLAGGIWDRSVEELSAAASLGPRSPWPFFYLALAHWKKGDVEASREAAERWRRNGGPQTLAQMRRQAYSLERSWNSGESRPGPGTNKEKDGWLARILGLG